MRTTTTSRSLLGLLAGFLVLGLALAGCSSDDDGDESSGDTSAATSGGDAAIPTIPLGDDVDLDAVNEAMREYLEETVPGIDTSTWEITAIDGETSGVTLGPTEGNTPTVDDARAACEGFASIVYGSLPTAVISVEDAEGTVVVDSAGPGGSCQEL